MTPTNHGGHHYSDAEMHNEDVAHEHSDINIRTVLAFGAGMAVVVVASALLVLIVFRMLERQEAAHDPDISPVAAPVGQEPPAPQLLTDEPGNLRKVRAEETNTLDRYGWVDQQAGVAHVPIEEAKKLLVQHGLPVRASGAVDDPRTGTHAPAYGEASGGRNIAIPKGSVTSAGPAAPQGLTTDVKK
jgi:hypothetical protein